MLPDLDEKVRHAHRALAYVVEAELPQHEQAYAAPIDTDLPAGAPDRSTPRAQTRQDFEEDNKRRSVRMSVNLAGRWSLAEHHRPNANARKTLQKMTTTRLQTLLQAPSLTTANPHSHKTATLH
jgi:hypothetical protein